MLARFWPTPGTAETAGRIQSRPVPKDPRPVGSLAVATEVAEARALETATQRIPQASGSDLARQGVLSALLQDAAEQADTITFERAQQRTRELAQQLSRLGGRTSNQ